MSLFSFHLKKIAFVGHSIVGKIKVTCYKNKFQFVFSDHYLLKVFLLVTSGSVEVFFR